MQCCISLNEVDTLQIVVVLAFVRFNCLRFSILGLAGGISNALRSNIFNALFCGREIYLDNCKRIELQDLLFRLKKHCSELLQYS